MPPIYIKNVNIINPFDEEPLDERHVVIKDGKIVSLHTDESAIYGSHVVIDGEDNYLLPGFIDSHAHVMANGFHKEDTMKNPLALHFYNAVKNMKDTIDAGVTTVRDCGLADIGVKMAQEKKIFPAPKLNISVKPLAITGGHFDFYLNSGFDMELNYPGFPVGTCDGVEGVLRKTREVIRACPDFIKIMASGGILSPYTSPEVSQFNAKELKTIVDEAKNNRLKVVAHCHSLEGIEKCAKAGIKSIEHGTFIDKKTSQLLAKKRIYLTPTLIVHHTLIEEGFPSWDKFADDKTKKLKEVVKIQKENIATAYEEGVKFLMGSDCGVIDHGRNLGELKYLVDVGLSPLEAIQAGTIEGARFFNQENQIGSIEEGKNADMIIVRKNPIDDIESLGNKDNVLTVIQDGEILKNKPIF